MTREREVELSETATADIVSIFDYLAERIGHERAEAYVGRIETFCRSLGLFSERGRARDELAPGLRSTVFESRAVVVYRVDGQTVRIVRIIHGGQHYDADSVR